MIHHKLQTDLTVWPVADDEQPIRGDQNHGHSMKCGDLDGPILGGTVLYIIVKETIDCDGLIC